MSNTQLPISKNKIGGGAVGGACGALMVLYARSLPPENILGQWVNYIAPTVSIGVGVFSTSLLRELKALIDRYKISKKKESVIKSFEKCLNDPNISPTKKTAIKKQYEEFMANDINNEIKDFKKLEEGNSYKS